MTNIEQVSFENQLLKNVTLRFAVIFIVGSFVFGLTTAGAIYAYTDTVDKRFGRIEKKMSEKELSDYFRREQIDKNFSLLQEQLKTVQEEHRGLEQGYKK